jgi:hypothetical protein
VLLMELSSGVISLLLLTSTIDSISLGSANLLLLPDDSDRHDDEEIDADRHRLPDTGTLLDPRTNTQVDAEAEVDCGYLLGRGWHRG